VRVGQTLLESLEQKAHGLRALHLRLRDLDASENVGGRVAGAGPGRRLGRELTVKFSLGHFEKYDRCSFDP
jgi:hypothetical protein